ncbi:hypothetical protein JCM19240_2481 [Vibrio maritimus]|uniref:Solute-binding protein family 3/N-terminal domain-containing protein n=1 Tax=Vibrio maritimus TaxID=990268 RepID=A0A090T193_9VIBR|nr:hypothetical protein JCM19240_2481 [Vibrio maritimus]
MERSALRFQRFGKAKITVKALTKICLALNVFFVGTFSASAVERITLATQIWTPYQTVDSNGTIGGVAVDRVKCALGRMGQPYEIRVMRWDKAQLMVETGEMHGFFAGSSNSRRAQYATASYPIVSENLAWFIAPNIYAT